MIDLLRDLPEPTPEAVRDVRIAAGLTQAEAARACGLSSMIRWSEYERGVRTIDRPRWAVLLLAVGLHPTATAAPGAAREGSG